MLKEPYKLNYVTEHCQHQIIDFHISVQRTRFDIDILASIDCQASVNLK